MASAAKLPICVLCLQQLAEYMDMEYERARVKEWASVAVDYGYNAKGEYHGLCVCDRCAEYMLPSTNGMEAADGLVERD